MEIDDVWLANPVNRHKILSSLWTIVRHWDAAGRPLATGKPRKGFETWCRILGGMVEFAGFGDCLERPRNLENCGDTETEDIRSLVEWASRTEKVTILTYQQVVNMCWDKGFIPWCLHGKEDYHEDIGGNTLRLTDAANSRMGMLLQRNCSGERGELHVFRSETGKLRHVRFFCRGKGRGRRFHFEDVTDQHNKPD